MSGGMTAAPFVAPIRTPAAGDSVRFTIYKLQHAVGSETAVTSGGKDERTISAAWAFRYIGSDVRLQTSLALGRPVRLEAHGQTSTLTDVDLAVSLAADSAVITER